MENGKKKGCGFDDEMVAYLYHEIGDVERGRFEKHLARCQTCTDEFASISHARFSVVEWQQKEFAPLATPTIALPYRQKSQPATYGSRFASIWASFLRPIPLAGFAAALCLVAGIFAIQFIGNGSKEIAANTQTEARSDDRADQIRKTVEPARSEVAQVDETSLDSSGASDSHRTSSENRDTAKPIDSVRRHYAIRQPIPVDRNREAKVSPKDSVPQLRKAPILGTYEEIEDASPRLTDMFDEVAENSGGRE